MELDLVYYNILNFSYNLVKYKENSYLLSLMLNYILFFSQIYTLYVIVNYHNKFFFIYKKMRKTNKRTMRHIKNKFSYNDDYYDDYNDDYYDSYNYYNSYYNDDYLKDNKTEIDFFSDKSSIIDTSNNIKDNWEGLSNLEIKNYINNASNDELNDILDHCSKKVLIPNWYSRETLEYLIDRPIELDEWIDILYNYDEYNNINDVIYELYK